MIGAGVSGAIEDGVMGEMTVGVVGAGTMGAGIVQVALTGGYAVRLFDAGAGACPGA